MVRCQCRVNGGSLNCPIHKPQGFDPRWHEQEEWSRVAASSAAIPLPWAAEEAARVKGRRRIIRRGADQ